VTALAAALVGAAMPAAAHPAPFSYLDVRVEPDACEVGVVVHIYDVAHDLGISPMEQLLDDAVLRDRAAAIQALVASRLTLLADGRPLAAGPWSPPEAVPERQAIRLRVRHGLTSAPGRVTVSTVMFPYDPQHQTFVNFYERGTLASQAILDRGRSESDFFSGTRQGVRAVMQKFIPSGMHHILIGPDHLLFLVGLLLLGGTLRQLALVVTAFTLAHSVTLSLAALNVFTPPAQIVEPAIALSIVYVGADNLLVRGGRDMRAWIAFAFGLIHGFGFANVLRDMELPGRALGWSLFSFNLGVEIGQLLVVVAVGGVLVALRSRSDTAGRRLAVAGSVAVIAAGTYWFIQRVFFSGGMA
jgi:hydrogenase/urease accessory protein HupE